MSFCATNTSVTSNLATEGIGEDRADTGSRDEHTGASLTGEEPDGALLEQPTKRRAETAEKNIVLFTKVTPAQ